jgi:hypothetical protein
MNHQFNPCLPKRLHLVKSHRDEVQIVEKEIRNGSRETELGKILLGK